MLGRGGCGGCGGCEVFMLIIVCIVTDFDNSSSGNFLLLDCCVSSDGGERSTAGYGDHLCCSRCRISLHYFIICEYQTWNTEYTINQNIFCLGVEIGGLDISRLPSPPAFLNEQGLPFTVHTSHQRPLNATKHQKKSNFFFPPLDLGA